MVDHKTINQEMLLYVRVKVLRGDAQEAPNKVFFWLEDFMVPVHVEVDLIYLQLITLQIRSACLRWIL